MQKIRKKVLVAVAIVAIFSSIALADGDMGGGGLTTNPPTPPTVTVHTPDDGDLCGCTNTTPTNGEYGIDWLLSTIGQLLGLGD